MSSISRFGQTLLLVSLAVFTGIAKSEEPFLPGDRSAAEILSDLQRLQTIGSVLYVAAHPDDENTRLISFLSKKMKLDVAYLSLTRGDGGQNLIGPELRESLGMIRTQELLAARRVDGGTQFFSRAIDFGYSKSPDETLRFWDGDEVLSDMVWVIRQFQPDVIVARFNPEGGRTHGHHTASAMLAMEAFSAAADPTRFSDQLEHVGVWQAKRIVWNGGRYFFRGREDQFEQMGFSAMEVGGYDPLLGRSFGEIAATSRSMHKSQGFGSAPSYESGTEYFKHLDGAEMSESILDSVETSWVRLDASGSVKRDLEAIVAGFNSLNPSASLDAMLDLRRKIEALGDNRWTRRKLSEVDEIIAAMLGLHLQARANARFVSPGDSVDVEIRVLSRNGSGVSLEEWALSFEDENRRVGSPLNGQSILSERVSTRLPKDQAISQPYWLRSAGSLGMFKVENPLDIGRPENGPAITVKAVLNVRGQKIAYQQPLVWRTVTPVDGEILKPVVVVPEVAVSLDRSVQLFPNFKERGVEVTIESNGRRGIGVARLELPGGWVSKPKSVSVDLNENGLKVVNFRVQPPKHASQGELRAVVEVDGRVFDRGQSTIAYDHFPEQTLFSEAVAKVATDSIQRRGDKVGYLQGAGDSIPASLREIGYSVEMLAPDDLTSEKLAEFDAIVMGIRAFNTIEHIEQYQPALWDYAASGGVVIVQYNTSHRLITDSLAPYSLSLSRNRVTDETAPISILEPNHPALNTPNKIGLADFEGWTQERGLYFPSLWSDQFTALLASSDAGEAPLEGGLLVADHGQGYFVYTTYSWFRQLPAGVPGAYRVFANLVSLGQQ